MVDTGAYTEGSNVEGLLTSLNEARGTAINTQRGTVAWVEDYAIAMTLADAWETCRRFGNQFDPIRLTAFLERWEKILSITPAADATLNFRRQTVAAKWKLFNKVPTTQAAQDFLNELMPTIFVGSLHTPSQVARVSVPGGATVGGAPDIPDGDWLSTVANLNIRTWQPTRMTDAEFYQTVNVFRPFFEDFLPAHVTYDWGRYGTNNGTVTMAANSIHLFGTGTAFLTGVGGAIEPGEEIEVIDDNGALHTLNVLSVESDTHIIALSPAGPAITDKEFKRFGFYLDYINVDNSFLK